MSFSVSTPVVPQALTWGVPEPPRTFYIPQGAHPAGFASLEDAFITHRADLKVGDTFILSGELSISEVHDDIIISRQWALTGLPGCTVDVGNQNFYITGCCAFRNIAFTGRRTAIRVRTSPESGLVSWGSIVVESCTFTGFIQAFLSSATAFPITIKQCEFFLPDTHSTAFADAIVLNAQPSLTEISGCIVHGNAYNPALDRYCGPNFIVLQRTSTNPQAVVRIANNRHADGLLRNFVYFNLFPDAAVADYGSLPKIMLDIRDNSWTDHAAGYNIGLNISGPAAGVGPLFIFSNITLVGNTTPNASGRGLLNLIATIAIDASGHCPILQAGNQLQNPRITAADWLPAVYPDAGLVGYPGPGAAELVDAIQYPPAP